MTACSLSRSTSAKRCRRSPRRGPAAPPPRGDSRSPRSGWDACRPRRPRTEILEGFEHGCIGVRWLTAVMSQARRREVRRTGTGAAWRIARRVGLPRVQAQPSCSSAQGWKANTRASPSASAAHHSRPGKRRAESDQTRARAHRADDDCRMPTIARVSDPLAQSIATLQLGPPNKPIRTHRGRSPRSIITTTSSLVVLDTPVGLHPPRRSSRKWSATTATA